MGLMVPKKLASFFFSVPLASFIDISLPQVSYTYDTTLLPLVSSSLDSVFDTYDV